jgi:uncharacterized protein (DUF305 family)
MYSAYLRLDITVHAGWRAVIRAAAGRSTPHARRDRAQREARRRFYRQMLEHHRNAQRLVRAWRL